MLTSLPEAAKQQRSLAALLLVTEAVTPLEAKEVLGISRLAARIYELRLAGFCIEARMKRDMLRKRYMSYRLVPLES